MAILNSELEMLAPILGTVDAPDGTRQLTVADVPGLIEGASEGVGLGHEFLAHLERANLLLHVIDSSEDDAVERAAERDHLVRQFADLAERGVQARGKLRIVFRRLSPGTDQCPGEACERH